MSAVVKAPKCRDGQLKNHFSTIKDESVEWKDGVAEVSEETWEVLKGIKGYEKVSETKEPVGIEITKVGDKTVKEVISDAENSEPTVRPELTDKKPVPEIVGEMVTVDNTVKEIRAFAKNNEIALGNAQSKKDLLNKIKKHFG